MFATYFLKRVLPFALALLAGVGVWTLANPRARVFGDLFYLERGGGRGWGRGHRAKRCRHHRRDSRRTYAATEVTSRAVLLSKPEPGYTEEARARGTSGVVTLRMALGADGRVSNIEVLEGLPDGLSERAIDAAERIQFAPAQRDARPVSQWVTAEYVFQLH
jgi:TonB family protein